MKEEGLPWVYCVEVLSRTDSTIVCKEGGADTEIITTYKKGVGIIKTESAWGLVIELISYDLNK